MADLSFEIVKNFGVLSTSKSGWTTELNKVKWGEHEPKIDIRSWDPEHKKCGKGITLSDDEARALFDLLGRVINGDELVLDKKGDA